MSKNVEMNYNNDDVANGATVVSQGGGGVQIVQTQINGNKITFYNTNTTELNTETNYYIFFCQ